jgi:hypothetical protein
LTRPTPPGRRHGPDEAEQAGQLDVVEAARGGPLHRRRLEALVAGQAADLGAVLDRDARVLVDAVDEVAGHRGRQVVAPDQDAYLAALARQEQGGLPGGVAAAEHGDPLAGAHAALGLGGGVVDAAARLQPVPALDLGPAVLGAGGQHHGPGGDLAAVGRLHHGPAVLDAALEHDDQVVGGVARPEQHVAGLDVALGAVPAQHVDLLVGQLLVDRGGGVGHGHGRQSTS